VANSTPIFWTTSLWRRSKTERRNAYTCMRYPDDLRYTRDHEWLRLEADGKTAVVGITDFAQSELGDIVFVEIEEAGTRVEREDVFGTVEAVKTVSELFMPLAGTIVEINGELEGNPELVNSDPYQKGWMVRIELDDPSELEGLMSAAEYGEMVS
jgi:glycine cleavage system H protein